MMMRTWSGGGAALIAVCCGPRQPVGVGHSDASHTVLRPEHVDSVAAGHKERYAGTEFGSGKRLLVDKVKLEIVVQRWGRGFRWAMRTCFDASSLVTGVAVGWCLARACVLFVWFGPFCRQRRQVVLRLMGVPDLGALLVREHLRGDIRHVGILVAMSDTLTTRCACRTMRRTGIRLTLLSALYRQPHTRGKLAMARSLSTQLQTSFACGSV